MSRAFVSMGLHFPSDFFWTCISCVGINLEGDLGSGMLSEITGGGPVRSLISSFLYRVHKILRVVYRTLTSWVSAV